MAVELAETESEAWWKAGWSLDAIATGKRAGFGVAKDLVKRLGVELDVGVYGVTPYREWKPEVGVGVSVRF